MSVPLADSADLQSFLGLDSIDDARATLILGLAQDLCESIVAPLPDTARAVVLAVAARAYTNPGNVQQETTGPFSASYGAAAGGMYLTRPDKATLRRLAGSGGAYSIETLPAGVSCVQTLTVTATSGTYTLTFNSQTTTALSYVADAAAVQSALEALGSIGVGNVAVTGLGPYVITFTGDLATTPLPTITVDTTNLTGTATVVLTTAGVQAPGQGLAWWDSQVLTP